MRHLLLFILIVFSPRLFSQKISRTEALIDSIENNDLEGYCMYVWHIQIKSSATSAHELIEIGKPVTELLLGNLTDNNKGVISHVLLSRIWLDSLEITSKINDDSSIEYVYNGLHFMQAGEKFYAKEVDLIEARENWLKLLRDK